MLPAGTKQLERERQREREREAGYAVEYAVGVVQVGWCAWQGGWWRVTKRSGWWEWRQDGGCGGHKEMGKIGCHTTTEKTVAAECVTMRNREARRQEIEMSEAATNMY